MTMFFEFILRLGFCLTTILTTKVEDTASLTKNQLKCGYATTCDRQNNSQRRCDSFPGRPTDKLFEECKTKLPRKVGDLCQITINAPSKEYFGHIRSEGYTAGSHESHQCLYKIQTQPGHKVRLYFRYFDLPPRKQKCADFVQLFDAQIKWSYHQTIKCYNKTNATCFHCGKELQLTSPISINNWIYITTNLRQNGKRNYHGFQLEWDIIDMNSTGRPRLIVPIWPARTTSEGLLNINNTQIFIYPKEYIYKEQYSHAFSFTIGPIVGGCVLLGLLVVLFLGIHTCIKHNKRRQHRYHDGIILFTPEQFQMQNLRTPPPYSEHDTSAVTSAPPPYPGPENQDESEVTPFNLEQEISDIPPPYSDNNNNGVEDT